MARTHREMTEAIPRRRPGRSADLPTLVRATDAGIAEVVKITNKGRYQVRTADGGYHEIPLKLFHPHTREGSSSTPA
jgi:hypothetical protein